MLKAVFLLACGFIAGTAIAEPTIWLIGDSTVCNYSKSRYPQTGWGQMLPEYCKPGVKVENHAAGGRSTKSFIAEGRWDKVMAGLKKGDFLMIQFGHNDQKKNKAKVYAPADGLYQELLKKYISEAKSKGVSTVLVTSVMRRVYDKKDGKLKNTLGGYPDAMKKVANETDTPVIDLNKISYDKMLPMSQDETKKLYNHCPPGKYKAFMKGNTDNSHFNEYGAKCIAGWVVDDAKKQKLAIAELFK